MAIIRGQVNSAGGNELGTDYSVSKPKTGIYVVKYDKPFAQPPVVVTTALAVDDTKDRITTLFESSKTGFSVSIMKGDHSRKDSAFNFYASDDYNA